MTITTTVSTHLHFWEDDNGELVDATVFCSDHCHRFYCHDKGVPYTGWNGCHEVDAPQWCAYCEEAIS